MERCPICTDEVNSDQAVATCGACAKPIHLECLRHAMLVDSRCPLCRQDFAQVGYREGGSLHHPKMRRYAGEDHELSTVLRFVAESGSVLRAMKRLCDRMRRWSLLSTELNVVEALGSEVKDLRSRVEVLHEQQIALPRNLPADFVRTLGTLVGEIKSVMSQCQLVSEHMLKQKREMEQQHARKEAPAKRPAAAQARGAARKRPAAAPCRARGKAPKAKAVMKRPSARRK
mmetsp:Transcript_19722/g.45946  ORF Transcript_19722/g.45946 Transcript_19722/m.45946 type:complete len:230 (+) Transcript_19722:45-734(+)